MPAWPQTWTSPVGLTSLGFRWHRWLGRFSPWRVQVRELKPQTRKSPKNPEPPENPPKNPLPFSAKGPEVDGRPGSDCRMQGRSAGRRASRTISRTKTLSKGAGVVLGLLINRILFYSSLSLKLPPMYKHYKPIEATRTLFCGSREPGRITTNGSANQPRWPISLTPF